MIEIDETYSLLNLDEIVYLLTYGLLIIVSIAIIIAIIYGTNKIYKKNKIVGITIAIILCIVFIILFFVVPIALLIYL